MLSILRRRRINPLGRIDVVGNRTHPRTPSRKLTLASGLDQPKYELRKAIFLLYLTPLSIFYQILAPWSFSNTVIVPSMITSFRAGAHSFHVYEQVNDPQNPLKLDASQESTNYLAMLILRKAWSLRIGRELSTSISQNTRRLSYPTVAGVSSEWTRLSKEIVTSTMCYCRQADRPEVRGVVASMYGGVEGGMAETVSPMGLLRVWWLGSRVMTRVVALAIEMDMARQGVAEPYPQHDVV
ncbi:hypothetical protein CYLTODRAFT_421546 [Cylindrobasidium torrendii FP15055 ss-10]|uniref:Uncharacterized protein n=1 Tax=Cylindrobasidium torrendii FP15055 ss-10 TaxID=1314674 RepID=A0A0D7BEA9_9AGAR|nr:hypothetical protein CYLTODRAFT_421546 [Cylindrobasidium torrendii FP15055 ss-10]